MYGQFLISKNIFNFLVTINAEKVTVQTGSSCKYKKGFCEIFAGVHTSNLIEFLKRKNNKQDDFVSLLKYHSTKHWLISEVVTQKKML